MESQINPKVVGAAIIGFAIVAGAYTVSNFGQPRSQQQATVQQAAQPLRLTVDVVDADQNGIEDWRDEFITTKPIILDQATSSYEAPDTLTGQMGVNFFQDIIRARGYGPFGRTDEEVIADTVKNLSRETTNTLYDIPDATILATWTDADIVNYANRAAEVITRNNISNTEGELVILNQLVTTDDSSRIVELQSLANAYKNNRDQTLSIPVPGFLVKQHLDLINTYSAIYTDIEAMTKVLDDPTVTLLRLKRYQDDADGLGYALQNMYLGLEPHAGLFTVEDPAAIFVLFSPTVQL